MPKTVALVQARMGSTRFPGKMLAQLGGHPLLEWVLHRVRRARMIDAVVLATTTLSRDDELVALAQKFGVQIFRGSETDVLGRFAAAASQYGADIVVRVCADNPFIDPDEIDRLVSHFKNNACDYACNHQDRLGNRYADGFGAEILSSLLLQQVAQTATDARHHEHATLYLWDHAHEFCLSAVPAPHELAYPELRFDVDQPQDLTYLKTLVDAGVAMNSTASEIVRVALNRGNATLVTTDIRHGTTAELSNTYFLGAWCFSSRHDEKQARSAGTIIQYHWDDRNKLKQDFERLGKVNEELLDELSAVLNQLHGVSEDKIFWRLLLGYWLNIYTTVMFDRWASLEEAKKLGMKWKTEVLPIDDQLLVAADTAEFVQMATESSQWNHSLFTLIARYFPTVNLIPVDVELSASARTPITPMPRYTSKQLIRDGVGRFLNCPKSRDRFFLISTYLPRKKIAGLEMSLGQLPFPRLGFSGSTNCSFDLNWRKWSLPVKAVSDKFSLIVRELLPRFLPRIFLEGFQDLMARTNDFPWPQSPKVIFTSCEHFSNDAFKAWAAQKIVKGSRLVIGEHGGMGAGLFNGAHRYELSVADAYLSTGWTNVNSGNVVPLGYFRSTLKKLEPKPTGKALLVCGIMPRFSFDVRAMMLSSQVLDYFEDQFCFVDALPRNIQNQIMVRLAPQDYGWEQKERWLDRHPAINFDDGQQSMLDTAVQCRLFIATYMATTYIESLVSNIPTVMFWNTSHWETNPEAQPYFDKLKGAGIFHESATSAACHISNIWDDIPIWWQSDAVQSARQSFCDRYASTPPDIDERLKQILLEEACRSTIRASR